MSCCEIPDKAENEETDRKYSEEYAIAVICSLSKLAPIPRQRILTPLCLIEAETLVTESVDFPAIITTSKRALALAPAPASPTAAPPPAAPPPELANRDDWHVDRAAPAAHDPPSSFT